MESFNDLVEFVSTINQDWYFELCNLSKEFEYSPDMNIENRGSLILEEREDFYIVHEPDLDYWMKVNERGTRFDINYDDSTFTRALYVSCDGRYAFIMGDFTNLSERESKEVPPL